jgi:hypothetical protein
MDRWHLRAVSIALVAVSLGGGCGLLEGVHDCNPGESRCGATPGTHQQCDGGEGYFYWGLEQQCFGLAPVCVSNGVCEDQPNAAACSTEVESTLGGMSTNWSPKGAADFDGDGLVDILFIGQSKELDLARGTGGGAFSEPANIPVPTGKLLDARAADVDGDHHLDLVLSIEEPPSLQVLIGKGDGTFVVGRTYAIAAPLTLVGTSDLDADGRDEILATVYGTTPNLQIVSRFTEPELRTQPIEVPSTYIVAVQAAQIVRGGPQALVALTELTGYSTADVLLPKSTGGYDAAIEIENAVAVADVDKDGLADMIVSGGFGERNGVAINEQSFWVELSVGDGTFRKSKAINVPANYTFVAAADVDGDHNIDFVTLYSSRFLTVFKGRGDGTFESPVASTTDASWTDSPHWLSADLDNDGRTDIAAPSTSLGLLVMRGACVGQ